MIWRFLRDLWRAVTGPHAIDASALFKGPFIEPERCRALGHAWVYYDPKVNPDVRWICPRCGSVERLHEDREPWER